MDASLSKAPDATEAVRSMYKLTGAGQRTSSSDCMVGHSSPQGRARRYSSDADEWTLLDSDETSTTNAQRLQGPQEANPSAATGSSGSSRASTSGGRGVSSDARDPLNELRGFGEYLGSALAGSTGKHNAILSPEDHEPSKQPCQPATAPDSPPPPPPPGGSQASSQQSILPAALVESPVPSPKRIPTNEPPTPQRGEVEAYPAGARAGRPPQLLLDSGSVPMPRFTLDQLGISTCTVSEPLEREISEHSVLFSTPEAAPPQTHHSVSPVSGGQGVASPSPPGGAAPMAARAQSSEESPGAFLDPVSPASHSHRDYYNEFAGTAPDAPPQYPPSEEAPQASHPQESKQPYSFEPPLQAESGVFLQSPPAAAAPQTTHFRKSPFELSYTGQFGPAGGVTVTDPGGVPYQFAPGSVPGLGQGLSHYGPLGGAPPFGRANAPPGLSGFGLWAGGPVHGPPSLMGDYFYHPAMPSLGGTPSRELSRGASDASEGRARVEELIKEREELLRRVDAQEEQMAFWQQRAQGAEQRAERLNDSVEQLQQDLAGRAGQLGALRACLGCFDRLSAGGDGSLSTEAQAMVEGMTKVLGGVTWGRVPPGSPEFPDVLVKAFTHGALACAKVRDLEQENAHLRTLVPLEQQMQMGDASPVVPTISFRSFAPGDMALFFPTPKGDYLAFNVNCPHHYLSEESKAIIGHDRHFRKCYVLGRIVEVEVAQVTDRNDAESNPYDLEAGTPYFKLSVASATNEF